MKRFSARTELVAASLVAGLLMSGLPWMSVARADECDTLAAQLGSSIEGLKIGKTVANVIYLEHPAVKQASLGCRNRSRSHDVHATSPAKIPPKEFYGFVSSAAAIVFSIPVKDTLKGALRCAKAAVRAKGKNVETRFRRLDISCSAETAGSAITISRKIDG